MKKGTFPALVGLAAVGVVGLVGFNVLKETDLLGGGPEGCTTTVEGHSVSLEPDQGEYASLIAAIGVERDLPARAVSIALATAYQESDLHNIDYGDRDSLGLFQQRPSQGWGTRDEIMDPVYSTNAFYDALVEVDGYRDLEITEAAQRVQRSAFPTAYADHEDDARALASALTGNSEASFVCGVDDDADSGDPTLVASGLTARAEEVRRDVVARFPDVPLGGFAPGGVSDGHIEGSAHYDGRAVDLFVRPINADNQRRGWAIAHYLVAQAERLQVRTIIFDAKIWRAGDDEWRDYDVPSRSGDRAILEHRDHVHVDVFS